MQPFTSPAPLLRRLMTVRIATELWWANEEFSPVDIIPPWFPMLMYHLADE
jgi:hypothetical protein